jgi:AcrR family transcriptional regulator
MQMRDTSREKIRLAALSQFSKKGLFAARIQDIAEEAGISQGLMYRYYNSKDEIFADLIEDALDKISKASTDVLNLNASAREKLLLSLSELFKTIETSESFRLTCRLISQAMNSDAIPEKARQILEEKRDIPYQVFARIMEQGQNEKTIVNGDPYDLAILFWSTVNGLAVFYSTRALSRPLPSVSYTASMFLKDKQSEKRETI